MNPAYTLADCSQDCPRRERPGVKTRRSGLCQHSVLGKIRSKKSCSLQLGIQAGLRVDSAPQSNRGCRSPDPLHQILCSVFIFIACSWTFRAKLLPSIFPSIRVFSNQSVLRIRWPKYWSFSISPSNKYSRLISFRNDWFDLFDVQRTQDSSSAPQFESINSLALSLFMFGPTLTFTHDYWINRIFD